MSLIGEEALVGCEWWKYPACSRREHGLGARRASPTLGAGGMMGRAGILVRGSGSKRPTQSLAVSI